MGIFTLILNHYKNYFRSFEKVKPTRVFHFSNLQKKKKSLAKHIDLRMFRKSVQAMNFYTVIFIRKRDENSTSKKSTSKFLFLAREMVTINIGLMKSTDKNDYNLGPIRESHLPVKVQSELRCGRLNVTLINCPLGIL